MRAQLSKYTWIIVVPNSRDFTRNAPNHISCTIHWDVNQLCPPFIATKTLQALSNQQIDFRDSVRFIYENGQRVIVVMHKTIEGLYSGIDVWAWKICCSIKCNPQSPTVWVAKLIRNALKRQIRQCIRIQRRILLTDTVHECQLRWETQRLQYWRNSTKWKPVSNLSHVVQWNYALCL